VHRHLTYSVFPFGKPHCAGLRIRLPFLLSNKSGTGIFPNGPRDMADERCNIATPTRRFRLRNFSARL
jgi:hypothetical protein